MQFSKSHLKAAGLSKSVLYRIPANGKDKKVYLTFNDGPNPQITPWVAEQLKNAGGIKATFFCVGEHAEKQPQLIKMLKEQGHEVANHSQGHESGWSTPQQSYFRSFLECENTLGKTSHFRPPYGRITPNQVKTLAARTQIVLWDVDSCDFDTAKSGKQCLDNLIKQTQSGSIVVFRDSERSAPRLLYALPHYLKWLNKNGYKPSLIPKDAAKKQPRKLSLISQLPLL